VTETILLRNINYMTQEISYKLGRYKIIEGPSGGLWWESHSGIGSAQTGSCFIEGNILIIGSSETEKPGYLKREFMEHLNKLSPWEKTEYYCLSHALHKCDTDARITFDVEMGKHLDTSFNIASNNLARYETSDRKTMFKQSYSDNKNIIPLKGGMKAIWNRVRSMLNL